MDKNEVMSFLGKWIWAYCRFRLFYYLLRINEALYENLPDFGSAATATPKKVGPVSYYGALHTSGNKIIGAKNNQQAMFRGVSLYWSDAIGFPYYDPTVISWAVDNLKIDVFRYVMGVE